ncbi:hypothetical protein [Paenibacillus sp. Soil787]|uniref:hypothetical protein n=1 Tax=Paenibacillus sp. Soil787 TaxID=1736411 RepID=UPI0006FA5A91|nr:hypothetical protein [Paenibacillus sp. Soil787]KRF35883.1 hypothetical protein ASG93_25715 [Paenibacillus sp. Soil787]
MATGFADGCFTENKLKFPCYGFMNIIQIDHRKIVSKQTPFKVIEVSPWQMGFTSYLSLPINENVIWKFQFRFQNEELSVSGVIREQRTLENGYAYIVEWLEEDIFAGVIVQQTIRSRENRIALAFEKAVRGYVNSVMNTAAAKRFDVSC